jgi:hypothetical protein
LKYEERARLAGQAAWARMAAIRSERNEFTRDPPGRGTRRFSY